MSEMLSSDALFSYMQEELARHTLQNNHVEMKHIRRAAAFLAQVANQVGDSANHDRFARMADVAARAMHDAGR